MTNDTQRTMLRVNELNDVALAVEAIIGTKLRVLGVPEEFLEHPEYRARIHSIRDYVFDTLKWPLEES